MRAREDADVLVKAQRMLGVDLFGGEAVRGGPLGASGLRGGGEKNRLSKMSAFTNESEWEMEMDLEDEEEGDEEEEENEEEEEEDGNDGKRKYPKADRRKTNSKGKTKTKGKAKPPLLDVSEIDVARIFPRVVSHRLGLRETAEDEVVSSLVFPACFSGVAGGDVSGLAGLGGDAKESVKDVLVGILGEV